MIATLGVRVGHRVLQVGRSDGVGGPKARETPDSTASY
jgi:hypothetical protein